MADEQLLPETIKFDVTGALKAGYSQSEVADYLGTQTSFDVAGARSAGYRDDQIISYLSPQPKQEPMREPAPASPPSGTLKGIGKGLASGALGSLGETTEAVGSGMEAIGGAVERSHQAERDALVKQIDLFDKIDAGEKIKAQTPQGLGYRAQDPSFYAANKYMAADPDERAAMRQEIGKQIAEFPALEDTTKGDISSTLKGAGRNVKETGRQFGEIVKETIPITQEEQSRETVQFGQTLGGLGKYVAAGVLLNLPGIIGLSGVDSFGKTREEALKAGMSDADATGAGLISGAVQGSLNAAPIGMVVGGGTKAVAGQIMERLPDALKGKFMNAVTEALTSAGTLLSFTQVSTIADNLIAQSTFEPERKATQGLGEGMLPTALAGAILPGATSALGAIGNRIARAAERTPAEAAKPVMDAPSADIAIREAMKITKTDIDALRAEGEQSPDYTATRDQAGILDLFHGLGEGDIFKTPDKNEYTFRWDKDDKEYPLRVWDENMGGEGTISPDLVKSLRDVYRQQGIRMVVLEDVPGIKFDGAVSPDDPNTIFLSNKSSRFAGGVARHEGFHAMEDTVLPDKTNIADQLRRVIAEEVTSTGLQYGLGRFKDAIGAPKRADFPEGPEGKSLYTDALVRHVFNELGADTHGEALQFPDYVGKVIDNVESRFGPQVARGALQKLMAGFRNAMETLKQFFVGEDGPAQTVSQTWFRNISRVHDVLAQMDAAKFGEAQGLMDVGQQGPAVERAPRPEITPLKGPVIPEGTAQPPNTIRFYSGGDRSADGRQPWLTPDLRDARMAAERNGEAVRYVDLPADSPLVQRAWEGPDAPVTNMGAPPRVASQFRELEPATGPVRRETILRSDLSMEESLAAHEALKAEAARSTGIPTAEAPADFKPSDGEWLQAVRLARGWDPQAALKNPMSLATFVRRNGGISRETPEGQDLAAAGLARHPGLLRQGVQGVQADLMAKAALDAGYDIPLETSGKADTNGFIKAVEEDARGRARLYPDASTAGELFTQKQSADEMRSYLSDIGLNPKGMTPRQVAWVLRQEPETARTISLGLMVHKIDPEGTRSLELADRLDAEIERAQSEMGNPEPGAWEMGDHRDLEAPTRQELERHYADYERATGQADVGRPAEAGAAGERPAEAPRAAEPGPVEAGEPAAVGLGAPRVAQEVPAVEPAAAVSGRGQADSSGLGGLIRGEVTRLGLEPDLRRFAAGEEPTPALLDVIQRARGQAAEQPAFSPRDEGPAFSPREPRERRGLTPLEHRLEMRSPEHEEARIDRADAYRALRGAISSDYLAADPGAPRADVTAHVLKVLDGIKWEMTDRNILRPVPESVPERYAPLVNEYAAAMQRADKFRQLDEKMQTAPQPAFSPRIFGERRETGTYTPELRQTFVNTGLAKEPATLASVGKNLKDAATVEAAKRFARGTAYNFIDPVVALKKLGEIPYMIARLGRDSSGAVKTFFEHAPIEYHPIAGYTAEKAKEDGGVIWNVIMPLQNPTTGLTEANRWIRRQAGGRAEMLRREGREHMISQQDEMNLKSLDQGTLDFDYPMRDGTTTRSRAEAFRDTQVKFNEKNKNVLDLVYKAGNMDKALYDKLVANPWYVSFMRVNEVDGMPILPDISMGLTKQGGLIRKLTGGKEKLDPDLWGNTMQNWARMIDGAMKNKTGRQILDFMGEAKVARRITEQDYKNMTDLEKAGTTWVMENGKQQHWQVDDPEMHRALEGFRSANWGGPLMDFLSGARKLFQYGTMLDPMVQTAVLIKDQLHTPMVTDLGFNFIKNFTTGVSNLDAKTPLDNMVRAIAGRQLKQQVLGGDELRLLAGGGLMSRTTTTDTGTTPTRASIYLNSSKLVDKVAGWFGRIDSAYQQLGTLTEGISRMAVYKEMMKQGVPDWIAKSESKAVQDFLKGQKPADIRDFIGTFEAKDVQDYSMHAGNPYIRAIVGLLPFANVHNVGLYKLARPASVAHLAIGLTALTALKVANDWFYKDDPEFQKRSEQDHNSNFWLKLGGVGFNIPTGFEVGALAAMSGNFITAMFDPEMTLGRAGTNVAKIAMDQLAVNPIPQLARPLVETWANKQGGLIGGRPIESTSDQRLDPNQRYTINNSMPSRGLSDMFNTIGVGLSPKQIDAMVKGYAGWLGVQSFALADLVMRSASSEPVRPDRDIWAFLTNNRIQTETQAQSRYVNMLYEQGQTIEHAYNTYKDLITRGRSAEAGEYLQGHMADISKYRQFASVKEMESRINRQIRMIENSPDMKGDQKKLAIDRLQTMRNEAARSVFVSSP